MDLKPCVAGQVKSDGKQSAGLKLGKELTF